MAIRVDFDPVAYMRSKGFSANQQISSTSGFSGTFTPQVVFGHWTASSPGSDSSISAVVNHHYHSCTNRSAHTRFGGYRKRQAHGGKGRSQPMGEARSGAMNAGRWAAWERSGAMDDTSSQPNQYGMSFCLDVTVNENVSGRAVDAWLAVGAMWLAQSQLDAGYATLHSVSTNRKIDVDYLIVDGHRWGPDQIFGRLEYWVAQFMPSPITPPTPEPEPEGIKMYAVAQHPTSDGYAIVKPDGGVYNFSSPFFGSAAGHILAGEKATDMCWTTDGRGYWVISSAGRVYAFGNAAYKGGCMDAGVLPPGAKLNGPATKIEGSRTNQGYRLSCDDGGLFCFGDAKYLGTVGSVDNA